MKTQDFTLTFTVDRTPDEVFDAINDVRGWWSGEFEGDAARLGAEFTYRYADVHRSRQRVAELVRGEKIVWQVLDARLAFVKDTDEWTGTSIVFDLAREGRGTTVRFTHVGLSARNECYDTCSNAWTALLTGNLRRLISSGQHQPDVLAAG